MAKFAPQRISKQRLGRAVSCHFVQNSGATALPTSAKVGISEEAHHVSGKGSTRSRGRHTHAGVHSRLTGLRGPRRLIVPPGHFSLVDKEIAANMKVVFFHPAKMPTTLAGNTTHRRSNIANACLDRAAGFREIFS
ncbi:hypothetical protein [Sphingomonas hengshuiensis]|uniref:hypothetical protein n=1 Tax=Sphingomonas hengshuiensis TaxID=1609977 RepID=UPI0012B919E6|nr:hypothetical protein [Sphingomonas hengshuiensis]